METQLAIVIAEKINQTVTILSNEKKIARDYGTGFPLNHAEIHLLDMVERHPGENSSQLAQRIGITKGAVAQITKKLLEKGLVSGYNAPENKKEVFFELTKLGKKAVTGHHKHHAKLNTPLVAYFETLTKKEMNTIIAFLDTLIQVDIGG